MKTKLLKILSLLLAVCIITTHFAGCSFDNEDDNTTSTPSHVCSYTMKVASKEYKSSDATCLKKAEYFYSCKCGKKGSTKFTYGNKVEHSYQNEKCIWCNATKPKPSTPETPTTPSKPDDTSKLVYITPTGKRYHFLKSCAGKNATETTITKAQQIGLTGCKKCT